MKRSPLDRFNWIALFYDSFAGLVFGRSIKHAQEKYLNVELTEGSKVLVLGGGTGWWLPEFVRRNPTVDIWYVEASSKMIELSKRRVEGRRAIHFIHGTEENIPNDISFDLVITFFLLDVFSNPSLRQFICKIKSVIRENGLWLVTDFVKHKFWHNWLLKVMYLFFWTTRSLSVLKLPNWELEIKEGGFYPQEQTVFFGGFIYSYIYKHNRVRGLS